LVTEKSAANSRDIAWILGFSALASLIMTFGSNSSVHDADSLLPAIMSIQKLTWYYWDQNRFANLLPLVAAPIKDAAVNMYFQFFLRNICVFGSIWFVLLLQTNRDHMLERFLLAVVVITLGAPGFGYFGVAIPHAISCALFGVGLYVLESAGRSNSKVSLVTACAFAAFLAAFFVNISLVIIVAPISFGCMLIGRYGTMTTIGRPVTLLTIAAAALTAQAHSSFFEPKTPSSLRYSPDGLTIAAKAIVDQLNLQLLLGLALGSLLAASLTYWMQRRRAEISISANDVLLVSVALGTIWLMVNLSWVHKNGYAARYFNVNLLILLVLFASWCVSLLEEAGWFRYRQFVPGAMAAAAIMAVCWTANFPILQLTYISGAAGKETDINNEIPKLLSLIDAGKPAILVGDYWYIVPTAFERFKATGRSDTFPLPTNVGGGHGGPVKEMLRAFLPTADSFSVACIDTKRTECFERLRDLGLSARTSKVIATGTLSAGDYAIFDVTPSSTATAVP
jgi:hypothetical protein